LKAAISGNEPGIFEQQVRHFHISKELSPMQNLHRASSDVPGMRILDSVLIN
jgi:hypothetical protein